MSAVEQLITENLDIWSSAIKNKSSSGRGGGKKVEIYGVNKLRDLITELAANGLLVNSDEPNPKKVKLEEIVELVMGQAPPGSECNKSGEGVVFVKTGEFGELYPEVKEWTTKPLKFAQSGDVLICVVGATIGKLNLGIDCAIGRSVAAIRPKSDLDTKYLYYSLIPFTRKVRAASKGSAQGVIGKIVLNAIEIRLPSLGEQIKIVAKVDELMALCDQLEQQQDSSISAHQTLVETLLAALTNASEKGEFTQAWARIAEHFDTLFTTEHSIDQLKQTILQLAVMGKLVPQDPNDEPASVLLEKIAAEKERLVKEGKIKKQKPLPEISEDEKPFELPVGWVWCKFGLLAEFINGDRGKNYPNKSEYVDTGIPWINTGHIEPSGTLSESDMNYITPEKFDSLRSGKIQEGDLVYCLRGATFGKTAFVEPYSEGAIASSLMIIRPFIGGLGSFFYRYLVSPFGRSQIFRFDNGSAQPNLSANSVMLYAFPCPPLNEQNRIVDKLAELFSFCDSLKDGIRESQITQLNLADAMAEQVLN